MNKKIIKIFTKKRYGDWLENLIKLMGGIGMLYTFCNQVYDVIYGIQCEQFYKIPNEYFYKNLDVDVFRLVVFILIFLLIINIPKYINSINGSGKMDFYGRLFLTITSGLGISYINFYIFLSIIVRLEFLNIITDAIGVFVLVSGLFMFVGFTISCKWGDTLKKICAMIISFHCLVLCGGVCVTVFQNVEDKRNYEIVSVENKEYVILSKKDDKVLVVPFSVEYNESGKVMVLHNDEYSLLDRYKGVFRFEHLECAPQMRVK